MIYAICIGKARDKNNNITQYKLRDFTGQETIFDASALKDYISKGRISICNLTLTSDNKLMEKKVDSLAELNAPGKVQHINMGMQTGMTPSTPNVIPQQSQHQAPTNNQIDPSNAYKNGEMVYYVAQNGNLNIKHMPSNTEETLVSKVGTACFIPRGHKLTIFYNIVMGDDSTYKYMILDMTTNQIIRNKQICTYVGPSCVGKKLCPDKEQPYYHDKNFDFFFVPIRAKENGSVSVVGMLGFSVREGEHFFVLRRGINAARCISRLMSCLTYTGNSVVPMALIGCDDNSTDLRCCGNIISMNKKLQVIECAPL